MSHRTYNELWASSQLILDEAITTDNSIASSSKPIKDRKLIRKYMCDLYVKYTMSIVGLTECYDQITHPQKRSLIKKTLDLATIRYLEIRHELVSLDSDEFMYFDEMLLTNSSNNKFTAVDVEIRMPECYRRERMRDIRWKNEFIDNVLKQMGLPEQVDPKIRMTEEEAILLIQMHERARQGRNRAQLMKNVRDVKQRTKESADKMIEELGWSAAIKIQRVWRGYITRKKIEKQVQEEMILIGMLPPLHYLREERTKVVEIKQTRYKLQELYQSDFEKALIAEKEYIQKHNSSAIIQEIKDQVRKWYVSYKQRTGKFPEIPSDDSGGSAAIIGRYSPLMYGSETSKSTIHQSPESGLSRFSKSKKSDSLQDEKRKAVSDDTSGYRISASNILADLMSANIEYEEIWKNLDEEDNPDQTFLMQMVRDEKHAEVETELRKVVDSQLRTELEELQIALNRDQSKKGKKTIKKKGKRAGKKKSKKKKEKDLTPDRSLESLFEELVANGIIRKYPQTRLSSFVGDISYFISTYRNQRIYTNPSMGDVRKVIQDYCILPLSSLTVHQTAPLVRSLLITGPRLCGKNMLINAICTEIGAVLFDLSAVNIVGKYPGKTGLVMLIHLINKVSKLLQPSIIYIDDAEKTFMRKVPKTDKTDPKRLKKDINKILKAICPNDLVMLVGVSHCPWECDQKSLLQTYTKIIVMLKPDYGTVRFVWLNLLKQYNADNEMINIPLLCKISDGYTIGTIIKAVQQLMTCKRILQLKIHPLTMDEIINVLSQYEPIYKEEEDAFLQWYTKIPMARNKQKNVELEIEENQVENKLSKKNK